MQRPNDEDALLQLIASVRELQDATNSLQREQERLMREQERMMREQERMMREQDRTLREFAVRTTGAFEKIQGTLSAMLEHAGEVNARLDAHEARLAALEGKKTE